MNNRNNHIGVWMDHHAAHLVYQEENNAYRVEILESPVDKHPRVEGEGSDTASFGKNRISNNEYGKNNKEQEQLNQYFALLKKTLEKYDDILLTGPTNAKKEFFNFLYTEKSFDGKTILVENADKMTENQLIAFVKDYFAAPKHK